MKKILTIITSIALLVSTIPMAHADDFVPADSQQNATNNYVLDADDSGGDIFLQFGTTLNESLAWNSTSLRFDLSDDLRADGNLEINGTSFTLDADNAGAGATVNIVAEQGSDPDGTLRYNTSTNVWEISNNGGAFAAISTGGGGSQDFEGVYTTDADKILTTSNGIFTVATGTNDFVVDSNDWNVTAAGALDAATITSNGLLTGSLGANISGATTNINASSNFATNIGTGSSTGQVNIGGNSNVLVFDGNNFDLTSAGAVTLTGNMTLSSDANEGLSGGGLTDCDASNQSVQWDSTTNKFSCTTAGNDTATFNDPTDDTSISNTTPTDLWDGTRPNITVDSTTSTVLVSVVMQIQSDDNTDEQPAFEIHRETNGTNPTCTDPQVGIDFWGVFVSDNGREQGISATFLDTPGVATNVRYTVCTADSGLDDGNTLDIQMTLVEMGN